MAAFLCGQTPKSGSEQISAADRMIQEGSIINVLARRFSVVAVAALLSACASTPNTFSNAAPGVDFSQYKTFGFYSTLSTDKAQYQSLESNFLKVAVAQELVARGFDHDEVDPDVRVNFYINTQEKIKSRSVPTAGGYYGYRDPFAYDPWGGYGMGTSYETRVDQFTEGTLNIDVVDARSQKLVWEGSIVGRLTDKDIRNLEQTVDEAVAAAMTGFPVQPGSR